MWGVRTLLKKIWGVKFTYFEFKKQYLIEAGILWDHRFVWTTTSLTAVSVSVYVVQVRRQVVVGVDDDETPVQGREGI
jgi:hypothetical protein